VPRDSASHCHRLAAGPGRITTQDPERGTHAKRLVSVEEAAERVYNFLHSLTLEVQMLARSSARLLVALAPSPRTFTAR